MLFLSFFNLHSTKVLTATNPLTRIMRPTVSHNIRLLAMNAPISPGERGVWTKIMIKTANMKLKVTRKTTKLLLLQKLRKRTKGVNEVEEYARSFR